MQMISTYIKNTNHLLNRWNCLLELAYTPRDKEHIIRFDRNCSKHSYAKLCSEKIISTSYLGKEWKYGTIKDRWVRRGVEAPNDEKWLGEERFNLGNI
jgi:hypothetical protein